MNRVLTVVLVVWLSVNGVARVDAQTLGVAATSSGAAVVAGIVIDGPPPPEAPAVTSCDDRGRATVRALRVSEPPRTDGRLDEAIYETAQPVDGFIQQEPKEGAPATERTDVWVLFDAENIYVSARCWDSHPERWVRSGLQRDMQNISDSENFLVTFDTFTTGAMATSFKRILAAPSAI